MTWLYNETSPSISENESCVAASDDDFVAIKIALSTTSRKTQYFAKYARRLLPLKVQTQRLFHHSR